MDHIGILERAVYTTARHRALWVLGFLWALVGGCSGSPVAGGGRLSWQPDGRLFPWRHGRLDLPWLGATDIGGLIALALAVASVLLVLGLLMYIAKYVLHAGIYRSLALWHHQEVAPGVRQAVGEGWHRRTWRLWLQNIIVDVPLALFIVVSLITLIAPIGLLVLVMENHVAIPILLGVAVFLGWLVVLAAIMAAVGVLKQLWWRAAVVGEEGFLEAMATGWRLARENLSDVAIMWLLMVVARIIWGAVVVIVGLVALLVTGAVAAYPAYQVFESGRRVLGVAYGVGAAFVTLVAPLVLAGGLYLVFEASVWTQVYQQLVARSEAG